MALAATDEALRDVTEELAHRRAPQQVAVAPGEEQQQDGEQVEGDDVSVVAELRPTGNVLPASVLL